MFPDSEFEYADPDEFGADAPNGPQPSALPLLGRGGSTEQTAPAASFMSELYAAAWTMARRDHEMDRLFNADFYQAGEI